MVSFGRFVFFLLCALRARVSSKSKRITAVGYGHCRHKQTRTYSERRIEQFQSKASRVRPCDIFIIILMTSKCSVFGLMFIIAIYCFGIVFDFQFSKNGRTSTMALDYRLVWRLLCALITMCIGHTLLCTRTPHPKRHVIVMYVRCSLSLLPLEYTYHSVSAQWCVLCQLMCRPSPQLYVARHRTAAWRHKQFID